MRKQDLLQGFFYGMVLALVIGNGPGCGLINSDTNKVAHITQIVVSLTGLYSVSEKATVFIDHKLAGTVTGHDVVSMEVDSGKHTVSATSTDGFQTWPETSVNLTSGATLDFHLPCDESSLTIIVDGGCMGKISGKLHVYLSQSSPIGKIIFGEILMSPGESTTRAFYRGVCSYSTQDDAGGSILSGNTPYLMFGQHYTQTITCP